MINSSSETLASSSHLGMVLSNINNSFTFFTEMVVFCFFSGTVDDTELVEGLVLEQKISHLAGGISQVEKAKIGLIQFCISPPKTDVSLNGLQ